MVIFYEGWMAWGSLSVTLQNNLGFFGLPELLPWWRSPWGILVLVCAHDTFTWKHFFIFKGVIIDHHLCQNSPYTISRASSSCLSSFPCLWTEQERCRRVLLLFVCLARTNVVIPDASKTLLIGNLFLSHRSAKQEPTLCFATICGSCGKENLALKMCISCCSSGLLVVVWTVLNGISCQGKESGVMSKSRVNRVILRPVNRILSEFRGFPHKTAGTFQLYFLLLKIASHHHMNALEILLIV